MNPVEIEFLVKNNTRQGLSGVSGGIDGVEKEAAEAQKKVQALEAEIARLNKTIAATPTMDQTENIRQIEALKKQLEELQKTTKQTSLIPPDAPAVQRTYNGLNMSIQQIAREMPTLAMGPQMFFMAISNNLPIFADSVKRAREEYEMLIKSGQKGTPVWKQIIKSLFSWQTALTTGIMLVTMYGKEIGEFVSNLIRGENAFDAAAHAAEAFHAAMAKGNVAAQEEITKLNLLYKTATDAARPYEERRRAVDKLQEVYPAYFGNMDAELIMTGNLETTYNKLKNAILETAKARAAMNAIVENEETIVKIESSPEYAKINALRRAIEEDEAKIGALLSKGISKNSPIIRGAEGIISARKDAIQRLSKDIAESLELPDEAEHNILDYIEALQKANESLSAKAEASFTTLSPEEKNERENNRRKLAEQTIKDAQNSAEELQTSLQKLREETSQMEIEALQEGAEKEREQIRRDYEKKRQQYEDEERKMLALIKKLRASGANVDPGAEAQVMVTSDSALAAAAKLRDKQLEEVDKKEAASYDELLQKYETYQQGRLRIAQQYDADIARLAEDPRNQAVAEAAKQKALEEFDVKFASQFPQFETFANRIVRMSVEDLKELLTQAQDELDKLEASNPEDQTIGVLRAKIAKLEEQLARAGASEELAPDDNSINRWKDLHDVLRDANEDLEQIGQQVGGTAGKILQLAGRISSSIITMIGGIQTMASSAAASMSSVEKASVVLTIISTVVQAATAIASLFKGGETSLERNLRLAREFNEELRIMKERSKINSDQFDTIFGERLYDRYRQNVDVARKALERLEATYERIRNRGQEVYNEMEVGSFDGLAGLNLVAKTWESEAESIANMLVQTRHSTWFRSAKYQSLGSLLPELFDNGELNMEALRKFVEEGGEVFQHLPTSNQEMLRSMVDDWELYEEAVGSVNDYLTSIFGELGNTLTDALVDAFENGTNAADTFVESVGQSLRELAKNMIYSMTLGKVFEKAQQQIDELNRSDMTDEERFAGYVETMKDLIAEGLAEQTNFKQLWEQFREIASDQGLSIDSTDSSAATVQTGKPGAIETVTQESFSRVEGLVTSIQIHAANIDASMDEGIVPTLGKALDELHGIRINTDTLPLMYTLLQKFDREGIKVK